MKESMIGEVMMDGLPTSIQEELKVDSFQYATR